MTTSRAQVEANINNPKSEIGREEESRSEQ